jgi:predicted nucleic acid-binding protein
MAIDSCLVDTNVLLLLTRRSDPQHTLVASSLSSLAGQGTILYYTHQNIAEFWNVLTRPAERNGLGLSTQEAEKEVQAIESGMILLPTARLFTDSGAGLWSTTRSRVYESTMPVWLPQCACTMSDISLP